MGDRNPGQEALAWSIYNREEERRRNEEAFQREQETRARLEREAEQARQEREEMLARMTPAQKEAFLREERRCNNRWSAVSALVLIVGVFAMLCVITPKTAVTPGSIFFFAAGLGLILYSLMQAEPWEHRWKRRFGYLLVSVAVLTATGVLEWFPKDDSAEQASLMSWTTLKRAAESFKTVQVAVGDLHV